MPVNTAPGTTGYDPVAHYNQITAHFPKQKPLGTHVSPPSTGTYPDPVEVQNYATNRRMIDRQMGDGRNLGRRTGDGLPHTETLFGEPATGRSVDFRGAGKFSQPDARTKPSSLPGSREDLDAMLLKMGLGPAHPEGGGLGSGVKNFFKDESGTLRWPQKGSPMPPNASSGDSLMEGYGLAPPKPSSPTRPAPTGAKAGPIPMKPGPGPKTKAMGSYPGEAAAHRQFATEGRLDRMTAGVKPGSGDVSGFANRGPGIPAPTNRAPQYGPATSGDDLIAAFESMRPPGMSAAPPARTYAPPPANVASAGTAETFMGPVQQIAREFAAMHPPNPMAQRAGDMTARFGNAANEFVKPKLGTARGAIGAAGLGLMFDTVNDPRGMANMVAQPGQAGRQMFEGFGAGANRIANGEVGAQDLVTAIGNSLGMGSAWNAGNRMGNTLYQGITDPRQAATNFGNGLGVIKRGLGF